MGRQLRGHRLLRSCWLVLLGGLLLPRCPAAARRRCRWRSRSRNGIRPAHGQEPPAAQQAGAARGARHWAEPAVQELLHHAAAHGGSRLAGSGQAHWLAWELAHGVCACMYARMWCEYVCKSVCVCVCVSLRCLPSMLACAHRRAGPARQQLGDDVEHAGERSARLAGALPRRSQRLRLPVPACLNPHFLCTTLPGRPAPPCRCCCPTSATRLSSCPSPSACGRASTSPTGPPSPTSCLVRPGLCVCVVGWGARWDCVARQAGPWKLAGSV